MKSLTPRLLTASVLTAALGAPLRAGQETAAPGRAPAPHAAAAPTQAAYWGLLHYFEAYDPPVETLAAALHYAAQSPDREAVLKPFAAQAAAKAATLRESAQEQTPAGEEAHRAWALLAQAFPAQVEAPPIIEEARETAAALAERPSEPEDSPALAAAAHISERLAQDDDPTQALQELRILGRGYLDDPKTLSALFSMVGRRLNSIHRTDHRLKALQVVSDLASGSPSPDAKRNAIASIMDAAARDRSPAFAEAAAHKTFLLSFYQDDQSTRELGLSYLSREAGLAGRGRAKADEYVNLFLNKFPGMKPPLIPHVPTEEIQRRTGLWRQIKTVFDPEHAKDRHDALILSAGLAAGVVFLIWLGAPWWAAAAAGYNAAWTAHRELWRGKRLLKIAFLSGLVLFPAVGGIGGALTAAYTGVVLSWIALVVPLIFSETGNEVFTALAIVDAGAFCMMMIARHL